MVTNETIVHNENSPLTSERRLHYVLSDNSPSLDQAGYATDAQESIDTSNNTPSPISRHGLYKKIIVLGMFCCLAFCQNSIFTEWNPIANSALAVFEPEWSASTLAWQINLATITSPIFQWPVWWAIQKYDLSHAIRWGAVFPIFLSASIAYVPMAIGGVSNLSYKWLTYGSYVFTGITGVVFFSAITRFSRVWFPAEQRATSTGLLCTFANLGGILPAIVGPMIVTEPSGHTGSGLDKNGKAIIKREITSYLLVYFVLSAILFIAYLLYCPSNTTSDASTVSLEADPTQQLRVEHDHIGSWNVVWNNFTSILRRPSVLYVMLLQSVSTLPHIWGTTLLTVTLRPLGVSQQTVGIMIITTTLVSFITTVLSSRLADLLFRFRLKSLILIILVLHTLAMVFLSVAALAHHPTDIHKHIVFVSYVVGLSLLNSASPLIYELSAEMSHPVPEDIVNGLCNQCNNFFGVIFYFAFSSLSKVTRPGHDENEYTWLIYTLMVVPSFVTIMFMFVRERYTRSEATSILTYNNIREDGVLNQTEN